jgi:hypothetical protein
MIKPSNPAAVQIPDGNNMGGNNPMNPMNRTGYQNPLQNNNANLSPGDVIRNIMSQNLNNTNAQSGGGFNWGGVAGSLYEDDALRSLRTSQENDPTSNAYLIDRVAGAMQMFLQQVYHRAGPFFEEYRKAREDFRQNEMQQIDEVRNAFIEDVNKQHEFTRVIAINAMPFFGKGLIELLRNGNRDQLQQAEYLNTAFIACRNVLFFEMVNWLMKSPNGRRFTNRLPKAITARIANLENFKEAAAAVYDVFNQTSPYNNLEFKRPESTRTDYNMLYGPASDYVQRSFEPQAPQSSTYQDEAMQDIYRMISINANNRGQFSRPTQDRSLVIGGEVMQSWDEVRQDFNNLNPGNRGEFRLNRFFYNIGKPNHYFIPESDWKKIQHAYRRHEEQKAEETVLKDCFRIVIIDLDNDSGWFSTIVRKEGLDMQTVLTDPAKLLPLLENPDELDDSWVVKPFPLEDVVVEKTMDIPIETVEKMEKAVPLIAVADPIISNSSKQLESIMDTANDRLTKNFTKVNAVGFHAVNWDTYKCVSKEEKDTLREDLMFLFKDNDDRASFVNAVAAVGRYDVQNKVSNELIRFIGTHLTQVLNNWLINCAGYNPNKNGRGHLSVNNILTDYRDLIDWLKQHDPETMLHLVEVEKANYLNESVRMFDYINPYVLAEGQEPSIIDLINTELELVVGRHMYVNVINKRTGPAYTEANVPVRIKRSKWPEYFKMVEDGFDETMTEDDDVMVTDKLLRFTESGGTWLFSYSTIDRNVATLRFVSREKPLCLLSLS